MHLYNRYKYYNNNNNNKVSIHYTHGLPAKNVPCDLHMEHMNRQCEQALSGLGSNITVVRIGKCIGKTEEILKEFDGNNNIPQQSSQHSHGSSKDDLTKILSQLLDVSQVFFKINQNVPTETLLTFAAINY